MNRAMWHLWCGIIVAGVLAPVMQAGAEQPLIQGAMIRQTKVEGYFLHYHLLNWKERNLLMKGMEGMDMPGLDRSGKATHHLLMYLRGADGKRNPPAKVGFQITAPDGSVQKTLTMVMQGGYGADVVLPVKGAYQIRTKMNLDTAILSEEFSFDLK